MTGDLFTSGFGQEADPKGDAARQAVNALRGFDYQVVAATLAWVDLEESGRLYLEVAEDYATIAEQAIRAVQVKDTQASGSVTLNSQDIKSAIKGFVHLVEINPDYSVHLRYFTTARIGLERGICNPFGGMPGLEFWKSAARPSASVDPLRSLLESSRFPEPVRRFCSSRDDASLRRDLLARIHWDCGKPGIGTLREELEARLIVVGRDHFGLPDSEARGLMGPLILKVLTRSTVPDADARFLTRAQLYTAIDDATRYSVQRSTLEALVQATAGVAPSIRQGLEGNFPTSISETGWLITGSSLPALERMIPRPVIQSAVAKALAEFGVGVLVGSSGVGKSVVARAVAGSHGAGFYLVDLQGTGVGEKRKWLDMLFARIGGLGPSSLILDNLNHIDPGVVLSLARLLEAGRRHHCEVLMTCYHMPSQEMLGQLGLDANCIVHSPHFSEEETFALVHMYGGDTDRWGRLAYVAGGGGHPQLTHAFIRGMASRRWPIEEIGEILSQGLSSPDLLATRDEARRKVASVLPPETRDLLYRLSITIGRFDRSLALKIASISPPLSRAGESIDQLVGPWLERSGANVLRVSPLASQFGQEMLEVSEQELIHKTIAEEMVKRGRGSADDMNVILVHAIAGKSAEGIRAIATAVLTADPRTQEKLAELFLLHSYRTDRQIYAGDPVGSHLLRVAQFKLTAAAGDWERLPKVVDALIDQTNELPCGDEGKALESFGTASVLSTMAVGNYLEDWLELLVGYVNSQGKNEYVRATLAAVGDGIGGVGAAALFSFGSMDLKTVERLEKVINELDRVEPQLRRLLLTPVDATFSDYSLLINRPWQLQESQELDALDAAMRYERMAAKTRSWDIQALALQCSKAQAIMLDEYLNDRDGALEVLREAEATLGKDPIITRTIAGIYHRHGEHREAVAAFREIVDEVGSDSETERAFALREAAISAALCGEWPESERLFVEAETAASAADGEDMQVMAVGLCGDAAVAAFRAGDTAQALARLDRALCDLGEIDLGASFRAAYCHRVIRHAVLWLKSQIKGSSQSASGSPVRMEVGACSNPVPPATGDLPLVHIDCVWYLLVEAETLSREDVGIASRLDERLIDGPIITQEIYIRRERMLGDVQRLDAVGFSKGLVEYVEAGVYWAENRSELEEEDGEIEPRRGEVPTLDDPGRVDPHAERFARTAILAYCIQSVIGGKAEALEHFEDALRERFKGEFWGMAVLDSVLDQSADEFEDAGPLEETVCTILRRLRQVEHVRPREFWMAGLRLHEWISQSDFENLLRPTLARWMKVGWEGILAQESFDLLTPNLTVPPVREVLRRWADDGASAARLILSTSEAVGCSLEGSYRELLSTMARE